MVAWEFVPLHLAVSVSDVSLVPSPELVPVVEAGDAQPHPDSLVPLARVDKGRVAVDRAASGPGGPAVAGKRPVSVRNDGPTPTEYHLTCVSSVMDIQGRTEMTSFLAY